MGISALAIGIKAEPMIGIGAFGFNTGVYVSISYGGSVLRQSDVAMTHCRSGYMHGVINGVWATSCLRISWPSSTEF